jgi:Cu/Ag efflux pump CusA
MTTIASLLGFLPLMFTSGAGARSQISVGTVVIGGLAVAALLERSSAETSGSRQDGGRRSVPSHGS